MKIIIIIFLIFLPNYIFANEENNNEVEVINLYESKSLDQMVLENLNDKKEIEDEIDNLNETNVTDIKNNETVQGSPAFTISEYKRAYVLFKQLPKLNSLVNKIENTPMVSVVAKRVQRSEGPLFQLLYKIHKFSILSVKTLPFLILARGLEKLDGFLNKILSCRGINEFAFFN